MTTTSSIPRRTRTTSAAGVLVCRDDQLLMVRQRRASGLRWEIPSGGQEPGEALEEAAAREVKEEAGITVDIGPVVCTYVCYRTEQKTIVMGAAYQAELCDPYATPVPQLDDGIVEAAYLNPLALSTDEIGHISALMIHQWWPNRNNLESRPFHLEVWRTPTGYRSFA